MRFFKEQVFASTVSNIIGTIIGHPLDTIKVKENLLLLIRSACRWKAVSNQ
jgi:hypothetical protein